MDGADEARRGVEPHVAAERDAPPFGPDESGDRAEHGALSGAGRAEEDGHAGRRLEGDVEDEAAACRSRLARAPRHAESDAQGPVSPVSRHERGYSTC